MARIGTSRLSNSVFNGRPVRREEDREMEKIKVNTRMAGTITITRTNGEMSSARMGVMVMRVRKDHVFSCRSIFAGASTTSVSSNSSVILSPTVRSL